MDNRQYNCPNCGAPIGYSETCQYCGTRLFWYPVTKIEFLPVNRKVEKLRAETVIHYPESLKIPLEPINKCLEQNLASLLHQYWVLSRDYDQIREALIYRAELSVINMQN